MIHLELFTSFVSVLQGFTRRSTRKLNECFQKVFIGEYSGMFSSFFNDGSIINTINTMNTMNTINTINTM